MMAYGTLHKDISIHHRRILLPQSGHLHLTIILNVSDMNLIIVDDSMKARAELRVIKRHI